MTLKKIQPAKMSRVFFSAMFLLTIMICNSCGESIKEKSQRKLIDSLEMANMQSRMEYENLQGYLSVIAEGLDSISIEEHELLMCITPGEKNGLNKQRMKQNLTHVREILARHRSRILELEKRLESETGTARSLRTIITSLRQQLEAKDMELAKLRFDLENNRKSITMLTNQVQQISEAKDEQAQIIRAQQETIEQQSERLHRGYIRIASRKELKESGLLSKGFLKRSKIDYSKIDLSRFQTVDIGTIKSIAIPRKAKILSPVPEGSYSVERGFSDDTIQILNSEVFWSISNFLIIQTK